MLVVACIARTGDITRSDLYNGVEYAKFQDMVISLSDTGDTLVDLKAVLTLCFTKEFKDRVNEIASYISLPYGIHVISICV